LNAPRETVLQSAGDQALNPLPADANKQGDVDNKNITTSSGPHPELEPVLIWSMTGLDENIQHKVRLALAALPSVDNAEMSIAKVVYTKVSYEPGQSRPNSPMPHPDPRYEGPLFPPHACKWEPQHSTLPLPTPTTPLPAPTVPSAPSTPPPTAPSPPPTPAQPSSGVLWTAMILLAFFNLLLMMLLLLVCIGRSHSRERRPIISDNDNMPPPYLGYSSNNHSRTAPPAQRPYGANNPR
jgi:hypothetical protein